MIKVSLIGPFGLHQFPVRIESPVELTSLTKLQEIQRWVTYGLKSGYVPSLFVLTFKEGF